MFVDRPVPFSGSDEERRANRATHYFGYEDRCYNCDCRPWGEVVNYPCGQEPPREVVEIPDGTDMKDFIFGQVFSCRNS